VLVGFGLLTGAGKVVLSIIEDLDYYKTFPPQSYIAVHIELALNVALFGLVIWTIIEFFRERRSSAAVLVPVIDGVLVAAVLNIPLGQVYAEKEIGQTVAALIAVAIWWWYMNVSVRVKNTFVK